MSELKLIPVAASQAIEWWESVLPFVESFVERAKGRYKSEDVLKKITNKQFQLWIVTKDNFIKAVFLTMIIKYPQLNDLRIVMMVGSDTGEWIDFLEKLEGYARSFGCAKITGDARPGWEKVLKPIGYEKTHVYLEKDL